MDDRRHVLILLAVAAFLLIGGTREAFAQQSTSVAKDESGSRTPVILTALSSPQGDVIAGQLASTITRSVALLINLTGRLTIERADFLTPELSFAHALQYYRLMNADGAVFGSVTPAAGGGYSVTLGVWNASSTKDAPTVLKRIIHNPLSTFSLADRLALEVASAVAGRKLTEGVLVVQNTGLPARFSVYADGHLLGRNRTRFVLLTGKREIVIARPGGPIGDIPVQVFHVDIRAGRTAIVRLTKVAENPTRGGAGTTPATSSPVTASTASAVPGAITTKTTAGRPADTVLVSVDAAGTLYLDGSRLGPVEPSLPRTLSALSTGPHRIQVFYRDGHIDLRTVEFTPHRTSVSLGFSHVVKSPSLQFEAGHFLKPATLVIDGGAINLAGFKGFSDALAALSALPGLTPELDAKVVDAKTGLEHYRNRSYATIGLLGLGAAGLASSLVLGQSSNSSAVGSAPIVGGISAAVDLGAVVAEITSENSRKKMESEIAYIAKHYHGPSLPAPASLPADLTFYAATLRGLSETANGGSSWRTFGVRAGIPSGRVNAVAVANGVVYAATSRGLSVSRDGGKTWSTASTAEGLASNAVNDVAVRGATEYAATAGGLCIGRDSGSRWKCYDRSSGLSSNTVYGVALSGATIYAATKKGLSVSKDGGASWRTYTTAQGLGSEVVNAVYAAGKNIYTATWGGVSVSHDGGTHWRTFSTSNGVASDQVYGVDVSTGFIYAATAGGLSVSGDDGAHWKTYTIENGLPSDTVNGVRAVGTTIYAATARGLSISRDGGAHWVTVGTDMGLASNDILAVGLPR